ncbi:hypothetical protein EA772_10670 [Pedobacter sp. G11]|uniref:HNH endonuclease n=1 Tax=Pedobacter sp. G11 TaxID=2482728 RepID=UPI000F5F9DDC|nr:HNH endonuclease [Pedobacter sp. G11]AZI25779.1 hypothetical protein EA772_10670 [Pedobacter sp. G11]
MEFTALDLIWTKNVTRDKGNAWAYQEFQIGDTFDLNFPLGHNRMGIASAQKAKANQLILLVQSIKNRLLGNPGTYLSHIVAPVDDNVELDPTGSHPVRRLVSVIARNPLMIVKPDFLDFREPNRGWTCSLDLIKPIKASGLSFTLVEKQLLLWNLFEQKDISIKDLIDENLRLPIDPQTGSMEGEEKYKFARHKYYERDPRLIQDKKNEALRSGGLKCEVCLLNFSDKYGDHGLGFMECHHRFPIAKHGKRRNRLEDLSLVCANCHRMLHRKNAENSYYSVEELKSLVEGLPGGSTAQLSKD